MFGKEILILFTGNWLDSEKWEWKGKVISVEEQVIYIYIYNNIPSVHPVIY